MDRSVWRKMSEKDLWCIHSREKHIPWWTQSSQTTATAQTFMRHDCRISLKMKQRGKLKRLEINNRLLVAWYGCQIISKSTRWIQWTMMGSIEPHRYLRRQPLRIAITSRHPCHRANSMQRLRGPTQSTAQRRHPYRQANSDEQCERVGRRIVHLSRDSRSFYVM